MVIVVKFHLIHVLNTQLIPWGESEWSYLENTKHLIFWLCNMKQLHFRHINTNSKKFTVTVNFFSRKKQKLLQRGNIISLSISRSFRLFSRQFPIISKDFRRLPKIPDDCRRFLKTGRCPKTSTGPWSTGSKFMSDFVTDFPTADKNWQR